MTKKPEKPNLDLINMVQQARLQHDDEATPSNTASNYWLETKPDADNIRSPTTRAGQWTAEIDSSQVDTVWQAVKTATKAGKLGYKSKVSTSSRGQQNQNTRTLVILTYDADDLQDVNRIKQALNALDIDAKWRYVRG